MLNKKMAAPGTGAATTPVDDLNSMAGLVDVQELNPTTVSSGYTGQGARQAFGYDDPADQ